MTAHALYLTSSARMITEADLTIFAMLLGDRNPVHVDEEFAKASAYGKRVVHGLYGPAIMTGFLQELGAAKKARGAATGPCQGQCPWTPNHKKTSRPRVWWGSRGQSPRLPRIRAGRFAPGTAGARVFWPICGRGDVAMTTDAIMALTRND